MGTGIAAAYLRPVSDVPHLNQAGGEHRPIDHPAVTGREVELRRLVDSVRRLASAVVDHRLEPADTAAMAERVDALAAELEAAMPPEPFGRFAARLHPDRGPHDGSPFDVVYGLYNPVAVPVRMGIEGDLVVGEATYDTIHEGAPGCVHGAVIAGSFDMVLSAATTVADLGGPTASLTSHFRRRTLLGTPVRYEGWVHDVDGRKVQTRGRLLQNGEVSVEAEALFIALDRAETMRLAERDGTT